MGKKQHQRNIVCLCDLHYMESVDSTLGEFCAKMECKYYRNEQKASTTFCWVGEVQFERRLRNCW